MRLATKYSLYIGLTLLASILSVIAIATWLSFSQSDKLQQEITRSIESAQIINNGDTLSKSAIYISRRLFSHITDMNISGLNSEIRHIKDWLPVTSFIILDQDKMLITDGSEENINFGQIYDIASNLIEDKALIIHSESTISLTSAIGFDQIIIGYALITLDNSGMQKNITSLKEDIQDVWDIFRQSVVSIILVASFIFLTLLLLISKRFSQKLTKPFREMSHAAENFSKGNLDYEISVDSQDEVGELATSLNKMAKQLSVNEQRWQLALDGTKDGVWDWNIETGEVVVSSQWLQRIGLQNSDNTIHYESWLDLIIDEHKNLNAHKLLLLMDGESDYLEDEYQIQCKDGSTLWILDRCQVVEHGKYGIPSRVIGRHTDISSRKQTEDVLRRAQKMEAVGQLTGGIAHDFNNLLGVIIGNLDLLAMAENIDSDNKECLDSATKAALRGADLTRQLLRFSRRQTNELSVIDVNTIINGMQSLIARSITPQIDVKTVYDDAIWHIKVNKGELEDALLNLVLNAKDAMPDSGLLEIHTKNIPADSKIKPLQHIDYVMLSVSDSGCGMTEQEKIQAFEPFFTTKGTGTGLGLSMLFGFIKRMNGHVDIQSEVDVGTSLRMYFPRFTGPAEVEVKNTKEKDTILGGDEHILIVDDETKLAKLAQTHLNNVGYTTSVAHNSDEALEILLQNKAINLIFSDVIMPDSLDGYALSIKAQEINPSIQVLLTSGFTRKLTVTYEKKGFVFPLLNKPYRVNSLLEKVRTILDQATQ